MIKTEKRKIMLAPIVLDEKEQGDPALLQENAKAIRREIATKSFKSYACITIKQNGRQRVITQYAALVKLTKLKRG